MNELSTEVIEMKSENPMSIFSNMKAFEDGQRMALLLAKSNIVPQSYQNNVPNVIVALEIANRVGVSPFMVMQNLDVIKGKPSWSSTFIIAVLNSCGRFSQLRFEFSGEGDDYGCVSCATDKKSGELLRSPKVDWKMVKAEGWDSKMGSKWKTMPDLMFHYRAASFFGRIYASDILKGMQSADEIIDVVSSKVEGDSENEEKKRVLSFIEKAENLKQLQLIKKRISSDLFVEIEEDYNNRENELILSEEIKTEETNQTKLL